MDVRRRFTVQEVHRMGGILQDERVELGALPQGERLIPPSDPRREHDV